MKNTLLLTAALSLATAASAQMPNYRICPDWTGTDIDGNTHNLYDLLDQGYTVVVDVSATWCSPCWNYHNTHALRTLYETHGPDGDDKVRVFFIEGESQNTTSLLYGPANLNGDVTTVTRGDWVTGTPYPIIDDSDIANTLEISYFPTIYRICPNRMIYEVGAVNASALWTSCQQCDKYEADSPSDASVLPNISGQVVCMGSPVDLKVRLQNTGTDALTSATVEAKRGTTVLGSVEWTGNLGTYELEEITVASFTPSTPANNIVYTITSADDETANNSVTGSVTADNTVMPGVNVSLELATDAYPAETTWKLFDGAGNVVAQDPPGNYTANTVYNYDWTLNDDECYRFEIYDAYGDGICCDYGDGYFTLSVNGEEVITGSSFTDSKVEPFRTSIFASVNENALESGLAIFPNPTEGRVNLNLDLPAASQANITVTNVLGAVVFQGTRSFGAGAQTTVLDLTDLAQGTYTLNILADGMTATRQVIIAH
ncbi:MAG: T9SS type A sorting domain-containing protein [Flavobacteriales bacterium]|nr:T9SS type A sorting domain-containing protein [Flavobacteriales bacterium]